MTGPSAGRISCVVDEPVRFHHDALRWFACLTRAARVSSSELVVHAVGCDSSAPLDFLRGRGVTVRSVERFDVRSPHCNKIAGARSLAAEEPTGTVVLCDADVAVLEDPRRHRLDPGCVAGKTVDAPNPPLDVLMAVFEAAGVPVPATVPLPWGQPDRTLAGNFNGGLYLVAGRDLGRLSAAWAGWARWLLDRPALLGESGTYVDQAAMTLALAAEGIEPVPLDVRWNTPTHDSSRLPRSAAAPAVLHYHDRVDPSGLLRRTGARRVDRRIEVANAAIAPVWREVVGNPGPDATGAEEGTEATGADGEAGTSAPPSWLETLVEALRPRSVLRVTGSGAAGPPARGAPGAQVDLQELTWAELAAPTGAGPHTRSDLTVVELGRDGVTTAPARSIRAAWDRSARCLVVTTPEPADRPLAAEIRSLVEAATPGAERYPIVRGGFALGVAALRPPPQPHPRDYGAASLAAVVDRHPDPLGLLAIRLLAQRTTGFYPDHAPRLWEYPVVADLVRRHLPVGSRLVDVGAGVSPLAPFLAAQGYLVDTVDPSPRRRRWPPGPGSNEWDFLDYGRAGLAHRSWNRTLQRIPRRLRFDGILSVSVIEHLPAEARRSLLADMARRARRPGALVILTIDLVRDTDDLWNRNLGVEVEPRSDHGTIDDVVAEAGRSGLDLVQRDVVRRWGDVEVDIGLLVLRRRP